MTSNPYPTNPQSARARRLLSLSLLLPIALVGLNAQTTGAGPQSGGAQASAAASSESRADTGTVSGRVLNAANGTYLAKASVRVAGTTAETMTNEIGEYRLHNLRPGPATLTVTYADMQTQSSTVTVVAGGIVQHDFQLSLSSRAARTSDAETEMVMTLDTYTVSERKLSAEAAALQQQKTAPNIMNVVSFDEFGDMGEGNPGEYLKFVPGVDVELSPVVASDVNIRGMPSSGTLVMWDGLQMANNNASERQVSMASLNVGNIDRVEVTKVPTPDLPANAVGGTINIRSKSNLGFTKKELTYNAYGTLSAIKPLRRLGSQIGSLGPNYKGIDANTLQPAFNLNYMMPVNESLGLSFSTSYSNRVELRDFLNETWDLVRGVQTANQKNPIVAPRTRKLLAGSLEYRLGSNHRVSAAVQYATDETHAFLPTFNSSFGTGATGGADFTQGTAAANGSVTQNVGGYNQLRRNMNLSLRYSYEANDWKANVMAGISDARFYTRTIEEGTFRTVSASLGGLILRADGLSGGYDQRPPRITATTANGTPVDSSDVRLFTLNTATGLINPTTTDQLNLKADLARDFAAAFPFTIKVGAEYDRADRDIRNQTLTWNIRPPASAGGRLVGNHDLVDEKFSRNWVFGDGSTVVWMDRQKVYRLYQEHPEYFELNESAAHISGVNGSKALTETISAGYIRFDARLLDNRMWVVGGVRYERTEEDGVGPLNAPDAIYQRDANGGFVRDGNGNRVPISTDPLERAKLQYQERAARVKSSYGDFYPSMNTSYSLTPDIVARAAYARTIGRPQLNQILPGMSITDLDSTSGNPEINVINTGLNPWEADNYDLSLEAYSVKGAVISLGVFRKDVTNFFTRVSRPVTNADLALYGLSPDYADYDLVTMTNSSDAARIEGFEWSWRQSLRPFDFVPDWAKGFQFYMNATRLNIGGPGANSFTPFRERNLNWGASYTTRKAVVRVNVAQQGPQRTSVLSTNATTPPDSYRYIAFRNIVDVSFEYSLNKHLAVYGSARNLFQNPRRQVITSPNAPAYTSPLRYDYYGTLLTLGIKGTF